YKNVSGDFVFTSQVFVNNPEGTGVPDAHYSLAGLMIRTPRAMTSADQWTPGGQNYVFLSLGHGDNNGPGTGGGNPVSPPMAQLEVKTTINSESTLSLLDTGGILEA